MTDVQLVGLFAVAVPLGLVVLATWVAPKRRAVGLTIAGSAMLLWAVALVPFVGLLAFERYDMGEHALVCERSDSSYYPSHWSWLPPGAVCEYPSGDVGPTYWRIPVALSLLATPALAFVVMWPRRFVRRSDGTHLELQA
jgi:hypothetical protein